MLRSLLILQEWKATEISYLLSSAGPGCTSLKRKQRIFCKKKRCSEVLGSSWCWKSIASAAKARSSPRDTTNKKHLMKALNKMPLVKTGNTNGFVSVQPEWKWDKKANENKQVEFKSDLCPRDPATEVRAQPEKSSPCFHHGLLGSEHFNKHLPFAWVYHTLSTFRPNPAGTGLVQWWMKTLHALDKQRYMKKEGTSFCITSGTSEHLIYPSGAPRPNRGISTVIPLTGHYLTAVSSTVTILETRFRMDCQRDKWEIRGGMKRESG